MDPEANMTPAHLPRPTRRSQRLGERPRCTSFLDSQWPPIYQADPGWSVQR